MAMDQHETFNWMCEELQRLREKIARLRAVAKALALIDAADVGDLHAKGAHPVWYVGLERDDLQGDWAWRAGLSGLAAVEDERAVEGTLTKTILGLGRYLRENSTPESLAALREGEAPAPPAPAEGAEGCEEQCSRTDCPGKCIRGSHPGLPHGCVTHVYVSPKACELCGGEKRLPIMDMHRDGKYLPGIVGWEPCPRCGVRP